MSAKPFRENGPVSTAFSTSSVVDKLGRIDDWNLLRVFLAFAEHGSIMNASAKLNVTQPTVRTKIRRLEDLWGVPLYEPMANKSELTERGKELAALIRTLDRHVNEVESSMRTGRKERVGLVRISATEGLSATWLAPSLGSKLNDNPGISISFAKPRSLTDFEPNQAEIMVSLSPVEGKDLVTQPIGWLHFTPVVSNQYIRKFGVPTLDNLENHTFAQCAYYDPKSDFWRPWNSLVKRGKQTHHAEDWITYAFQVKSGLGLGLLSNYTLMDGGIRAINLGVKLSVPMYLITTKSKLELPHVAEIFDHIVDVLGPTNPWFAREHKIDVLPSDADTPFKTALNIVG